LSIFRKFVFKIQFSLKSGKNNWQNYLKTYPHHNSIFVKSS